MSQKYNVKREYSEMWQCLSGVCQEAVMNKNFKAATHRHDTAMISLRLMSVNATFDCGMRHRSNCRRRTTNSSVIVTYLVFTTYHSGQ